MTLTLIWNINTSNEGRVMCDFMSLPCVGIGGAWHTYIVQYNVYVIYYIYYIYVYTVYARNYSMSVDTLRPLT